MEDQNGYVFAFTPSRLSATDLIVQEKTLKEAFVGMTAAPKIVVFLIGQTGLVAVSAADKGFKQVQEKWTTNSLVADLAMGLCSKLVTALLDHALRIVSGVAGIRGAIAQRIAKKAPSVVQAPLFGTDKSASRLHLMEQTAMATTLSLSHVVVMTASGSHGTTGVHAFLTVVTLHSDTGLARR